MAVHYPEFMRSACSERGMQVGSIDLGGALTYQGPLTAAQQAELVVLFSKIASANGEELAAVKKRMGELAAESEAKAKGKPKPPTASTVAKK